jgi:hypothetical protein
MRPVHNGLVGWVVSYWAFRFCSNRRSAAHVVRVNVRMNDQSKIGELNVVFTKFRANRFRILGRTCIDKNWSIPCEQECVGNPKP